MKGNFAWGSYGGFLAGSWRILGGTSASSRLNFQRLPKRQPEGGQKASRMPKRRRKGCQKSSKGNPKPPKNDSVFPNRFRMPPRVPTRIFCPSCSLHLRPILGAQIINFSCYLLASFLGAFLEASGCIVGVMFMICWRSLVFFLTL